VRHDSAGGEIRERIVGTPFHDAPGPYPDLLAQVEGEAYVVLRTQGRVGRSSRIYEIGSSAVRGLPVTCRTAAISPSGVPRGLTYRLSTASSMLGRRSPSLLVQVDAITSSMHRPRS